MMIAALALLAASLVACMAVYAAIATPGSWWPSAQPREWTAKEIGVSRGRVANQGESMLVMPADASNIVIVAVASELRSESYPVIGWSASDIPDDANARLLWRSDYRPGKLNAAPIAIVSGRLTPVTLSGNADWIGTISGLALAIQLEQPHTLRIESLTASPMGLAGIVRQRLAEWLAVEPWSNTSINTVAGGADMQPLALPVLLVATVIVAGALWLAWAWWARALHTVPFALATLFVAAWLIADARWASNLVRDAGATVAEFGGKDAHARRLAATDGKLYAFIERVRAKLPDQAVRIFMAADNDYYRGRGAYHLYPHNVYFDPFSDRIPDPALMHAGDYVVVYQRRGIQYDGAGQRLRWDEHAPVRAEVVLIEPGAALFRIL